MPLIETPPPSRDDQPYLELVAQYDTAWRARELQLGETPALVFRLQEWLPPGSSILDLGAGQGRLSLPLAEAGFTVTAVDASPVAMGQLQAAADRRMLAIQAVAGDIRRMFDTNGTAYEAITSMFVLHHLDYQEALDLMTGMQARTLPGGINALTTYGQLGQVYASDGMEGHYFPADRQDFLRSYAEAGWEILNCMEEVAPMPDGSGQNQVMRLLARKPF